MNGENKIVEDDSCLLRQAKGNVVLLLKNDNIAPEVSASDLFMNMANSIHAGEPIHIEATCSQANIIAFLDLLASMCGAVYRSKAKQFDELVSVCIDGISFDRLQKFYSMILHGPHYNFEFIVRLMPDTVLSQHDAELLGQMFQVRS